MKIPDEIVREAERAWEATPGNRFRAALQVAAKWAVGECVKVADAETADCHQPQYRAAAIYIAREIRKLAGGDDE